MVSGRWLRLRTWAYANRYWIGIGVVLGLIQLMIQAYGQLKLGGPW